MTDQMILQRFTRLEQLVQHLNENQQMFAQQLAEQNLRVRFVMASIELTRDLPGSLIDPTTNKPQQHVVDLFIQYMTGGRDRMLAQLEQERIEIHAEMEKMRAEGTPLGEGEAPGPDADVQRAAGDGTAKNSDRPERANGSSGGRELPFQRRRSS